MFLHKDYLKKGSVVKKRIALNGFGRIGKSFLRAVFSDKIANDALDIVAINTGPSHGVPLDYLFAYDTTMGTYTGDISLKDDYLCVDGRRIKIFSENDPQNLPWADLKVEWVVDASGKFTQKKDAKKHLEAGAKGVLITAPSQDSDATIVLGVNDETFKKGRDVIVSLASCTTNALVPVLDVLHRTFILSSAAFTTIHSYTNNQVLLDSDGKDPRRARAAGLNIIPTTTGATDLVDMILPALRGKIKGCSVRVPTSNVSLIDVAFMAEKNISRETINKAFQSISNGSLQGVLSCTNKPLVSSDFKHNFHSVVIDTLLTETAGSLGKVFGWYDNEWGYSCRLKDFLVKYG